MLEAEHRAMLANDERHWWYRGRRRVLDAVLDGLPLPLDARLLDAGCGSGRMLDELARYGCASGVDLSEEAIAVAHDRGHGDVRVAPVERLPFADGRFDVVTCLDVLEHTPDDRRSLTELRRVTAVGGHLLVTVPAYPALWSQHDVVNRHYRRYRRPTLLAAATGAGWSPVRATYFNSLLLAPAAFVRLTVGRRANGDDRSDLDRTPAGLDAVLELPLRFEALLVRHGARLPAGLSLLALLRNVDGRPLPPETAPPSVPVPDEAQEHPPALTAR